MRLDHTKGLIKNRAARMRRLCCIAYWLGWFHPGSQFDPTKFLGGLPQLAAPGEDPITTGKVTREELKGILSEFDRGRKERGQKFCASDLLGASADYPTLEGA